MPSKLLAVFVAMLVSVSCGSVSPTAPSTPAANLQAEGQPTWSCLSAICRFQGEARNVSSVGCANEIRGATRLQNAAGDSLASGQWDRSYRGTVRPRATFSYFGTFSGINRPPAGVSTIETEFFWTKELRSAAGHSDPPHLQSCNGSCAALYT